MRNPFQTVYCEDCEWCILDLEFTTYIKQLEFAKCKVKPKRNPGVMRNLKQDYFYCSAHRFCFKFKEKHHTVAIKTQDDE